MATGAASATSAVSCSTRRAAMRGSTRRPTSSNASWARATGSSPSSTLAPAIPRTRRRSCCAQIGAVLAGRRARDRRRLSPERGASSWRAGGPVDRVLQDTRDRPVVLRGDEEERVGLRDPLAEVRHRGRRVLAVQVLVVRRNELRGRRRRSTSTPAGASPTAARARAALYDCARRLPGMARTLMVSSPSPRRTSP